MAIKAGLGTPSHPGGFFETPVLFAAIRYDLAGVLMLAYAAYATDRLVPRTRTEWVNVLSAGALMIAAYHALLFIGETDPAVNSATAAVIVSLSPVLTTAFARLLLPSERLTVLGLLGMFLGLLGVVVLSQPPELVAAWYGLLETVGLASGPAPAAAISQGVTAKLLVFGAALAFALGAVVSQRLDDDLPLETMEAWAMLLGAGMMHVVSVGLGESVSDVTWSTDAIVALAYLSVAASALGFLIYFDLLEKLGAIEINLVSYVAPLFAAISGFLFLSEVVDAATVAGFLVILVGFGLLKRDAIREEFFGGGRPTPADD
ncbi:DMT family transporter [Natronomonas sp. EA1]|uniref:DMT family transporter n=1 Tax=Natronomonas sp. EA1 TaxID=3421655 RepID=UPI003EC05F69